MQRFRVTASRTIHAPAGRIYAIIADYREGHPGILPKQYFTFLEVEEGGQGAGTVIRFGMKLLGTERTMRARVSEPQPGRVLVETGIDQEIETTFSLAPRAPNGPVEVTFTTEMQSRSGPLGALERWMVRSLLARVYREELLLLARRAEGGAGAAAA